MSDSNMNHLDRDQHLAKLFSDQEALFHDGTKDPLYNILIQAQGVVHKRMPEVSESQIESAWQKLVDQLDTQSPTQIQTENSKIRRLNTAWIWSAAALLILSVSFVFHFLSDNNTPVLIAMADQSVETVVLPDGSHITLRPNSSLYQVVLGEFEHRYELTGQALFDVAPDEHRTFLVQTSNAVVQVVGTKFSVTGSSDNTEIYLIEGNVRFSNQDLTEVQDLSPGEASKASNNSLSEIFNFDPEEVLAWTQNRMIFSNRSLQSIISELNQHFNVQISVPDSVADELMGGSISLESLQIAFDGLSVVLDGNFIQTGPRTYRFTLNP